MEKPFLAQWLYEKQAMGWVDVSCGLQPADPALGERPAFGAQGSGHDKAAPESTGGGLGCSPGG